MTKTSQYKNKTRLAFVAPGFIRADALKLLYAPALVINDQTAK